MRAVSWGIALLALFVATLADSTEGIHHSFHANTVKSEAEVTMSDRKTRSKHAKENLEELHVSSKLKKRHYVAYPGDDAGIDTVDCKDKEDEGKASRVLRKTLKEKNLSCSTESETTVSSKKSSRCTRSTRKHPENLEETVVVATQDEEPSKVENQKPKKGKKKKNGDEPLEEVVLKKKSKKKKGKRSGSVVLNDIEPEASSGFNNESLTVDSFYSAAGSPRNTENHESAISVTLKKNRKVDAALEINKIIKSETRTTRSTMKLDNTLTIINDTEKYSSKSVKGCLDISLKDATFDYEGMTNTFNRELKKHKSSVASDTINDDKNSTLDVVNMIDPRKSIENDTFDKTLTPDKMNTTFDKDADEIVTSAKKGKKRKSVAYIVNTTNNSKGANEDKTAINTTFEKDSSFESTHSGKKMKSGINTTIEISQKISPKSDTKGKKKNSSNINTTSKTNTQPSSEEVLKDNKISIIDATFNLDETLPFQSPNLIGDDKRKSVINTTYEKDKESNSNIEATSKNNSVNATFDITESSSPFKSSNDLSSPLKIDGYLKYKSVINMSYESGSDTDTKITKSMGNNVDRYLQKPEIKSNTTFKRESTETVDSDSSEINMRKSLLHVSSHITDVQANNTFDRENKSDATFDNNSKCSLISSDNSVITLDKSDTSKISITSDESKNETKMLDTTPLLIEISIEVSQITTPPKIEIVTATPLKREGTFTKEDSEVSSPKPEDPKTPTTPTKRVSLPSAGFTPFHVNNSSKVKSVLMNVTRSVEKSRRSSSMPRTTKVMFCSPVNNPAVVTQNRKKLIKSNLKGSSKSFVFDDTEFKSESAESASTTGSSQEDEEPKDTWMRAPAGGVAVRSGEDALLTCVVLGARGRPVLWKRARDLQLLTAGGVRVTRDDRVHILHDDSEEPLQGPGIRKGGDVWALVIKSVKASDAGLYMCELNTEPPVRSFHRLTVISRGLTPPENVNTTDSYSANVPTLSTTALAHNYTDCCLASNVSTGCLGFCSIQSILEGTGQDPETCQPDFPAIVKCMADGRNHVPCCVQERVPDICQDVCRGEFTPVTDNIKTHYSCASYMEKTLACIVEGIELLPSPPEDVEVEPLTEKQLNVSWSQPIENPETVIQYVVNVTTLRSFDAHLIDPSESSIKTNNDTVKMSSIITHKVNANKTFVVLNDLLPFTMYEITVTAFNIHGSSLPSYSIRSLTLTPGKMKPKDVAAAPKLPDVRSCCQAGGVNHYGCIEKLCDPTKTFEIVVTDLMICAPWAGVTFGCLANGMDHTPCCRARGLPESCLPLCSGNITSLDFNHFKCLRYMTSYTNCLLQGYGVLPGAPSKLYLTNIDTDYAVVHWSPPAALADTVQYYNLHYKTLQAGDDYRALEKVHSPYILEDLESNTDYEIYVEAVNEHGVGDPSPRLIFRTQSQVIEEEEESANNYNMTACCERVQLAGVCMPLCSYDAKMSDLRTLAPLCAQDFHKLLRCGAGGRNHEACCMRRGVPSTCRGVCAGAFSGGVNSCVPYIGNIVQCFEEGTGILPGPPRELHAVVTGDKVYLGWTAPQDGANVTSYIVHWKKLDNNTLPYSYTNMQASYNHINVTDTSAHVDQLEMNSTYHVFVVAENEQGASLPSSMLLFNVTDSEKKQVSGIPSPPHSLSVSSHSATWLTLTWQPPQFSQPDEKISYTVYYKSPSQLSQGNVTNLTTTVPGYTLERLSPNTQYVVWVRAHAAAGDSHPSETLLAWTDPAYPAYVEPPTVNPVNLVVEGSSMTILCIAMGTPTPTISLYISGRLVRQEVTRHMVTVIHNVTRDMDQISCYADNGYGTPMQASRKINISHIPIIQASGITMAAAGDAVILECRVEALPKPAVAFWRDPNGRTPVIDGPNYAIQLLADPEDQTKYTMRLIIKKIAEPDEGDYFCHAENAFGKALRPVSVRLRPASASAHHNVTECCAQMNVSSSCIDACSFHLDMDNIMDRPECMNDFDKLMKCAADGSDHRSCCASWGVPRNCLELCRGGSVIRSCALQHARRALACFRDAGAKLPGPPRNLKAHQAPTKNSVLLSWDAPLKNPQTVYLYRVFWRAYGAKVPEKLDTSETSVVLTGLQDDVKYECVVKAANDIGTSSLSAPIMFTTAGQESGSVAAPVTGSGTASAVGLAMAVILVAAVLLAAGMYYRHRKNLRLKAQGGVAFENPSYLREPNPDTVINGTIPNGNGTAVSNGTNGVSNSAAWRQETLQAGPTVPVAPLREVDPTLYEELKLGHDGAGFKRLKP